jgi:hypothetical protein
MEAWVNQFAFVMRSMLPQNKPDCGNRYVYTHIEYFEDVKTADDIRKTKK